MAHLTATAGRAMWEQVFALFQLATVTVYCKKSINGDVFVAWSCPITCLSAEMSRQVLGHGNLRQASNRTPAFAARRRVRLLAGSLFELSLERGARFGTRPGRVRLPACQKNANPLEFFKIWERK